MMRSTPVPPIGQETRDIKPLPTRALQVIGRDMQEEVIDWKVLFKIGENWRNGARLRCLLHAQVLTRLLRPMHPSSARAQVQYERNYPRYGFHGF
jgi:hypothetical protein